MTIWRRKRREIVSYLNENGTTASVSNEEKGEYRMTVFVYRISKRRNEHFGLVEEKIDKSGRSCLAQQQTKVYSFT